MSSLFEQIYTLLIVPPGNLIYHLVLAFSVAGALQAAFNHWRSSEFPQVRRTMLGLSILLLAQLTLVIVSGLSWQGLMDPEIVLPPLNRAITMFSLVWITWLWVFPEPSRPADAGNVIFSLFTLTGLALSIVSWTPRAAELAYNSTLQDTVWQAFALGFIAIAAVSLLVRRPNGWGNGVAFLSLAFLGHVLYLIFNPGTGDFPGPVRLMYLAAYPILLTLPQRFPTPPRHSHSTTVKQDGAVQERRRYSTDPKTFHALLSLAAELDANKISHAITRAIAQTMLADLCFLIYLTEDKSQMVVASGYDLIREENLEGANLNNNTIPMLANALQRGRPLRLPASSTSPDLQGLGELLGLNTPGNLLSVPILTAPKEPIGGVLLLSPYSNRLWSADDQAFLANISTSLVPIIQRGQRLASLERRDEEIQQTVEETRLQLEELKAQKTSLAAQLEEAKKQLASKQDQAKSLAALLAAQEESQQVIANLQKENEELRAAKTPSGMSSNTSADAAHVEHELRVTLEEVARLQNSLAKPI